MASPPCCPPGSHGLGPPDDTHAPAGSWEKVAGLDVYVVGSRQGATSIILAFSDVFGPRSGRHPRICDEVAAGAPGSLVCMPDLFEGSPIAAVYSGIVMQALFGSLPMVQRIRYRCGWANVWAKVEALLNELVLSSGHGAPVGCFGFCWGGWLSFKCSTTGRFSAGVGFHPSLLVNKLQCSPHRIDDESMARAVNCPLLMLPAKNDEATLKPGGLFASLVAEKHPSSRSVVFDKMLHGWVSRGTEPDAVMAQSASPEAVAEAQQAAVAEAVVFFRAHLVAPSMT